MKVIGYAYNLSRVHWRYICNLWFIMRASFRVFLCLLIAQVFGLVVTCAIWVLLCAITDSSRNFLRVFRQRFINADSAFCMYNRMLLILSLFLFTQFGRLKWSEIEEGQTYSWGWLWIVVQGLILGILMLLADGELPVTVSVGDWFGDVCWNFVMLSNSMLDWNLLKFEKMFVWFMFSNDSKIWTIS